MRNHPIANDVVVRFDHVMGAGTIGRNFDTIAPAINYISSMIACCFTSN